MSALRAKPLLRPRGFVLLLIVLAILAIGGTLLMVGLGPGLQGSVRRIAQSAAGNEVLTGAKLAVFGYVASPPNKDYRPGTLPTPDSLVNGNYDGHEDASCLGTGTNGLPAAGSTSLSKRCLGKLPWKDLGIDVGNPAASDPTGAVPWLAISANLAYYDGCLWVLNSDSAKLESPMTGTCPSLSLPYPQPTALPHPWLTVVDENGAVLSNRVAAVLIMPGTTLTTESRAQLRSQASPGNPRDYLDDVRLPLGCTSGCTTYDNAGLSNTFVAIPPGTRYAMNAQDANKRGQPVPFNDQLAYITIDELLPTMERRVTGQMAAAINAIKASASFLPATFPWSAPHTAAPAATTTLTSAAGTYFGMMPFMTDAQALNNAYYGTDFDWIFSGFTEFLSPGCQSIASGPARYIRNTLTNAIAAPLAPQNLASGTVPLGKGICVWKGSSRVDCELGSGQNIPTAFTKLVTVYSNSSCTIVAGADTLNVSRAITSAIFDVTCPSAPSVTYTSASAIEVHRWASSCATTNVGALTVSLVATDTISNYGGTTYNLLPRTVSTSLVTPAAGTKQVAINRMRFLPIMPGWFHENRWYSTAFYGVAPGSAPADLAPCGAGVSTFSAGATQGVGAIALLASHAIAGAPRPSASIADYLEGQNVTGKGGATPGVSNCVFDNTASAPTSTANDQLTIISP